MLSFYKLRNYNQLAIYVHECSITSSVADTAVGSMVHGIVYGLMLLSDEHKVCKIADAYGVG